MAYKTQGSQTISENTDKGIVVIRASQFINEKNEAIFRVSVIGKNGIGEMKEDITSFDICKKVFEDFQRTYFGKLKKELYDNVFN